MFLTELNERERIVFLELAHHAMASSGQIKEEEQEVFNSYAYECEMPDYVVQQKPLNTLMTSAKSFTKQKRRIILMELWGIILADDEINEKETQWMESLADGIEISSTHARRISRWSKDFMDIIHDGYRLLGGD